MICTVSTVLDSVDNLDEFVRSNLRMGVDHMFLCIDWPDRADQAEVAAHFAEHPHVTVIRADDAWWNNHRPPGLNRRQLANANMVLFALQQVRLPGQPLWLFHIDADEVLALGPRLLDDVPADLPAISVLPAEAVSVWAPPAHETRFKTVLDDAALEKLTRLGAINAPLLDRYFHGHVRGKVGVRVGGGIRLGLHNGMAPDCRRYRPDQFPDKYVLHFHTRSGEGALTKAQAFGLNHGYGVPERKQQWLDELQAVDALPPQERSARTREIFDHYLADRVDLLTEHGLLMHVDVREHHHTPATFTPAQQTAVEAGLADASTRRRVLFLEPLPENRQEVFGTYPGPPARGLRPRHTQRTLKKQAELRAERAEASANSAETPGEAPPAP